MIGGFAGRASQLPATEDQRAGVWMYPASLAP